MTDHACNTNTQRTAISPGQPGLQSSSQAGPQCEPFSLKKIYRQSAFPETVESSELSLVRQWLLDYPSENKAPTRFTSSNEMLMLMVRDCTARRITLNSAHFYRAGTHGRAVRHTSKQFKVIEPQKPVIL